MTPVRAVPHKVIVARATRLLTFGAVTLVLLAVGLFFASCDRDHCWQNPACDRNRSAVDAG